MKLELKHSAPYLPYLLEVGRKNKHPNNSSITATPNKEYIQREIMDCDRLEFMVMRNDNEWLPILRPLSDLTLEHANNCDYKLLENFKTNIEQMRLEVVFWNDLLNNHYDVFGLIEKGLAIDINTVHGD